VDNLPENFEQTPKNGIWVESWYDDLDDRVLLLLLPFLRELAEKKVKDVRTVLTHKNKIEVIYKCLEEGVSLPSVLSLE